MALAISQIIYLLNVSSTQITVTVWCCMHRFGKPWMSYSSVNMSNSLGGKLLKQTCIGTTGSYNFIV